MPGLVAHYITVVPLDVRKKRVKVLFNATLVNKSSVKPHFAFRQSIGLHCSSK